AEGRARGPVGRQAARAPERHCHGRLGQVPGGPRDRQAHGRPRDRRAAREGRGARQRGDRHHEVRRPARARASGAREPRVQRAGGRFAPRQRGRRVRGGPDRCCAEGREMTEGIRTPGVERLQASTAVEPEEELDRTLRPRVLDDFVGQRAVKDQLAVFIEAARGRGEALDHVLLAGPPGLGKTSLAQIVANELDVPFVQTAGPALERKGDVAAFLTALEPRAVFFVDEIHRLPRAVEETFYPAMEDRKLPITVGQGAGARVVTLDLPQFTLIGATTRTGLLTTPLRDRFGVTHRLDLYGPDDLANIVERSAGILGVEV